MAWTGGRLLAALIGSLVLACAALALLAPAASAEDAVEEAKREVAEAAALSERSVEAVEQGDRERGYELAREAYIDHFEFAEIPLRLRDPDLVLDAEFDFAALRDSIESGAPLSEVREAEAQVQERLDSVERALTSKGVAAPAAAFGFSFSILFREGLEAVLLITILLGSLEAARASDYRRPLAWGVGAAVLATAVTFVLATTVIQIAPVDRELLEAGAALLAVLVLFLVSFWLVSRLEHRRWMEFMRSRVSSAVAAGGALAFAGLGFTAIYREGFEVVLFYQALVLFAEGLIAWVVLGAAVAAIALGGASYWLIKLGRRLPIKPLLIGGASVLLLLSVTFAGNAVRALQEGDVIGATLIQGEWARLPIFVAEMTGIHPTVEGIAVQGSMLAVYVLGALWFFGIRPRLERRGSEVAGEGATS